MPHTAPRRMIEIGLTSPLDRFLMRIAESADAVVIGSKLIALAENLSPEKAVENLGHFISDVRAALDGIRSEPGN